MDKYEYRLQTQEMLACVAEGNYGRAEEIADTIDWRRIKSVSMLCTVSNIYETQGRYEDAREILFIAYDRTPNSRKIVFSLAELAIKLGDIEEAKDCFEEFCAIAPNDANRYILKYELAKAQNEPLENQIKALEEFKQLEYVDKSAYELARLYEKAGMTEKCIQECDDIILWFSDGQYVQKAMDLKRKYRPLTSSQLDKYMKGNLECAVEMTEEQRQAEYLLDQEMKNMAAVVKEDGNRESGSMMDGFNIKEAFSRKDKVKAPELKAEEEPEEMTEETPEEPEAKPVHPILQDNPDSEAARNASLPESMKLSDMEEQTNGQKEIDKMLAQWEEKKRQLERDIEELRKAKMREKLRQENEEIQSVFGEESKERVSALSPDVQRLLWQLENNIDPDEDDEYSAVDSEPDSIKVEEPETEDLPEKEDYSANDISDIAAALENMAAGDFDTEDEEPESFREPDISEELFEEEEDTIFIPEVAAEDSELKSREEVPVIPEEETKAFENEESSEEPETSEGSDIIADEEEPEAEIPLDKAVPEDEVSDILSALENMSLDTIEAISEGEDIPAKPGLIKETEADEEAIVENPAEVQDMADEIARAFAAEMAQNQETSKEEDHKDIREISAPEPEAVPEEPKVRPVREEGQVISAAADIPTPRGYRPGDVTGTLSMDEKFDLDAQGRVGLEAGLTEEQKKIFSYFVPVRGMSEQLVNVLRRARASQKHKQGTSKVGNLIVMGPKGSGKTILALDVIKAIRKEQDKKNGKAAILPAESLNTRDIPDTIRKVHGGALVIEQAGKLSQRTINALDMAMATETDGLMIVLEDDVYAISRMLSGNDNFAKKFNLRLQIPEFINDELVTFGQTYAKEHGYKIDEMGILALYSRIDAMQKDNHAVSVAEVKDIMDAAIARSRKNSMKKTMTNFFKSKDKTELITLEENDFIY